MMDVTIYRERRQRALEAIAPGVLVLYAAGETLRNNDVHHPFRQDSDFYYLTGLEEPDSVALLDPSAENPFTIFVRPRNPEQEVWTGTRAGPEGALAEFGADAAYPLTEFDEKLADCFSRHERVYFRFRGHSAREEQVLKAIQAARHKARKGGVYPLEFADPEIVLARMRRLKDPGEVSLMLQACDITREAHLQAMKLSRPGWFEYEIEAVVREVFRRRGAARVAYEPIVAGGDHANILHYVQNNREIRDGDLVLIDAGCEFGYYAADVTRTFPVNGRFSDAQREIYSIVLRAQDVAIAMARPGKTLNELHQAAVRVVSEGLVDLGILAGPVEKVVTEEQYKKYYMHRTSHYLGMDVHDVGRYFDRKGEIALEPGVVITIEPGLYCAASNADCPARFRGIGVRIEDDLLIEPGGARVLSAGIPKEISDVEAACSREPV